MPPKKPEPKKVESPEVVVVVDPAVVAAGLTLERWKARADEVLEKKNATANQLKQLSQKKAEAEQTVKDLLSQVQDMASPRQKVEEPPPPVKGATKAKGKEAPPPPPPPPPVMDEEEQKRFAKNQTLLLNAFKKRRGEKTQTRVVEGPDGTEQTIVEEVVASKPTDIPEELWHAVLRMRDQRIQQEESLASVRQNIETLTARRNLVQEMERLVQYSYDAAQFDLKRSKERQAEAQQLAASMAQQQQLEKQQQQSGVMLPGTLSPATLDKRAAAGALPLPKTPLQNSSRK